jgi:glutamate/tyrosine decarboxylase-like PLP-dependent enzyme
MRALDAELDLRVQAAGRPLDEVLSDLRQIVKSTPRSGHRRFLNQLYGGRDAVATAGEVIAGVANTQMHTFKVAGAHVLMEEAVLRRMSELAGYHEGEGVFTPGGSIANLTAMVLARNDAVEGARETGITEGPLTVYSSADCHYSIPKNMGILGLGRRNHRAVPTDHDGHLDVNELRRFITEDRAEGARPVMINATSGTTVLGAFDPLREIAEVAAEEKIWLHVDGSYGASILLCDEHRQLLDGIELTDSLTWSPHKMMGIPLLCSVLLVRRRGLLAANLAQEAGYLFQSDGRRADPGTRSIQCGRRDDALKLWVAWQHHGDHGYREKIGRMFELSSYAAHAIDAEPELRLTMAPPSLNVCFEAIGTSSVAICERLEADGLALVGHAVVCGRPVIRLVCVNPELTEADIDEFLESVVEIARSLPKSDDTSADHGTANSRSRGAH